MLYHRGYLYESQRTLCEGGGGPGDGEPIHSPVRA